MLEILGIFRCSGRVIWISYYLILIGLIAVLSTNFEDSHNTRYDLIPTIVLFSCLFLQVYDLSDLICSRNTLLTHNQHYENTFLQSDVMLSLTENENLAHVVIASELDDSKAYYEIGQYAVSSGKTLNSFVTVHDVGRDDKIETALSELSNADKDTVFIFNSDDMDLCSRYDLSYYNVGDYIIGYVEPLPNFTPITISPVSEFSTD